MKKYTLLLVLALGVAACSGSAHGRAADYEHSAVVSPNVPAEIDIAGDRLDVKRYDVRERLDRELISFSYMHSSTLLIIKNANRYFPEVEPILAEMGVPDDFKYLMAVESNLRPSIVSPVGAAGLWQLMPETAKELGLEVNKDIDERFHTEKATRAACTYLLQAYAKYGNWWCVAAAYNAGQGYISGQLKAQKVESAVDLYMYQETSRYFFRIAALKIVMSCPRDYGFMLDAEDLYPRYEYREVKVDSTLESLNDWAIENGTTLRHLKEVNQWLRTRRLPNNSRKMYTIRILTDNFLYYDPSDVVVHDNNWIK